MRKDHEIFRIDASGNRHSIMTDVATVSMLSEYGLVFLESGDKQYMPDGKAAENRDPIAFIEGVIWANDH